MCDSNFEDWRVQEAERIRKRKEWLDNLKVGDEVAIPRRDWNYYPPIVVTIEGFTSKFIRANSTLFHKDTGYSRNSGGGSIIPYDDVVKNEILRYELTNFFAHKKSSYFDQFTTEQLSSLKETLEKWEELNNANKKEGKN